MAVMRIETEGRAGGNAELRHHGDIPYATFSVAVQDRKKNESGEWVDGETEWLNVVAWRGLAGVAVESVKKGTLLRITGRITVDRFTRQDGTLGAALSVAAESVSVILLPTRAPAPVEDAAF